MLHKETVGNATLELLKKLMADERLKDFVLVGGTALSLQMGHRISIAFFEGIVHHYGRYDDGMVK